MAPERRSVLHGWCVPAEWDAPTVEGGAGAPEVHSAPGLVLLAPPLVISEADLMGALGPLERLLMELPWS